VTHMAFLIACLSIAGIPPFSGFFSKEEILLAAWQQNRSIYWMGLITSGITAFYMFRLYFSIFWNKNYNDHGHLLTHAKPGEGGLLITGPLILLTIGSLISGFVPFGNFISSDGSPLATGFHLNFSILPVSLGLLGIFVALWLYKNQNSRPDKISASLSGLYKTAYHKFYIDEIYLFITKKILFNLVGRPAAWIDKNIVDGWVNLTGNTTQIISEKIKGVQSGKVQQYAIWFLMGAIGLALLFIYW
jgi:NADH-quinone oxidoreductase subunit L